MRKNLINVAILGVGIFLPLRALSLVQYDVRRVESIQLSVDIVVFAASLLLVYFNRKNRKQAETSKGWWLAFEIIGVLGICYSVFILTVLFLFRHMLT